MANLVSVEQSSLLFPNLLSKQLLHKIFYFSFKSPFDGYDFVSRVE